MLTILVADVPKLAELTALSSKGAATFSKPGECLPISRNSADDSVSPITLATPKCFLYGRFKALRVNPLAFNALKYLIYPFRCIPALNRYGKQRQSSEVS